MRVKLIPILIGLAFGATACNAVAAVQPAARREANEPASQLLDQARQWQNKRRDDLAREVLQKLLLLAPDHPDGLAEMGFLEIRAGHKEVAAKMLARLKKAAPSHPAVKQLDDMLRVTGVDKDKLRQARLLAKSGRKSQAIEAYRSLFPGGPPADDLGLEYWHVLGESASEWQAARDGLAKLANDHPDNLRYRLSLAEHETSRLPLNRGALQVLIEMARLPEYAREATAAWRGALIRLEDDPEAVDLFRQYLETDPDDAAIRNQLASAMAGQSSIAKKRQELAREQEARRAMLADPFYQMERKGIAALEAGKADAAEELLSQGLCGRPKDVDAIGAMGVLRMRQGHQAEAAAYFFQALQLDPGRKGKWQSLFDTASFWALMREAGDAEDGGELELAADKLQQALAIDPKHPYAIVSMARVHAKQGKSSDAEREYRRALQLEPADSSALSGLIRLYSESGRIGEARRVVAGLSVKQKSALGASLAGIEAGLYRLESDRLAAGGREQEAIALLERAVKLDAHDPWLRYDLARLYAKSGAREKGISLFEGFIASHPDDATSLYAYALYQSALDLDRAALATLARIAEAAKSPKILDLERKLWLRVQLQLARDAVRAKDLAKAKQILSQVDAKAGDDADFSTEIAYEWADLGETSHARELLERLIAGPAPLSPAWHLRYAAFLDRIGADASLKSELERLSKMDQLSAPQAEKLAQLRDSASIRESEALRRAGKLPEALAAMDATLSTTPGRALLLLERARISCDLGRFAAAEADYRSILRASPGDVAALEGLITLQVETGRSSEAKATIDSLSDEQRSGLKSTLGTVASMLRDEADRLVSAGKAADAALLLERGSGIDPSDPWVRYDLAKLYAAKGMPQQALALFSDHLSKHPADATWLYVLALYQSSQQRELDALSTLEQIPAADVTPKIEALRRSLWVQVEIARAKQFARHGQPQRAGGILAAAQSRIAPDLELETELAFAWAEIGDFARARELIDVLQQDAPLPVSWHLRRARLLDFIGAADEFDRQIAWIEAQGKLSPADREALSELRESIALRQADELRREGRLDQARLLIAPYLSADSKRVAPLLAAARIERDAKHHAAAEAAWRAALAKSPGDDEARRGLIFALIAEGKLIDALGFADRWLATGDDADIRQARVGILLDLEDYSAAKSQLRPLLAAEPNNSRLLGYAMRVALHDGRQQEAARLQERIRVAGAETNYRSQARQSDQQASWASGAVDWHMRTGTPGQSQLSLVEAPVEFKTPVGSAGQVFVRADAVNAEAGTVNVAVAREANAFGSLLLCQPNCPTGQLRQSSAGVSLAAGYASPNLKFDFGTTPIGFPVSNVVGGVTAKGDLGPLTLSVELSRRPVTSSLLSFAGTRDPRTGIIWGGVTANGVRLGLSRDDGGDFGVWSSLGVHRMLGTNVQSNDRVQLMAGGYWRAINREDTQLSIGLTGMLWRFKVDAGEYTFGHGGYYSPQRYRSIAVPVSFGQRFSRFSYNLRGSVSKSWSAFDAAPYFPTNPLYQAGAPFYAASVSTGIGYSVNASAEYQADPSLFLGGRFDLERSAYYAPNRLLLYLRSPLGRAAAQPVSLPPEGVLPWSQF